MLSQSEMRDSQGRNGLHIPGEWESDLLSCAHSANCCASSEAAPSCSSLSPALQAGWQGCLFMLPNSVSVWVSHRNLNNTRSRALLIIAALPEIAKEHSLRQLCWQTLQERNFGQRFCDKHSLATCFIRRFPFGGNWRWFWISFDQQTFAS